MTTIPNVSGLGLEEAVRKYCEAGLYLVPVRTGKHPGSAVGKGWPEKSSNDPETVLQMLKDTGAEGIALHVGKSGMVAFDVDTPEELPDFLREVVQSAPYQRTREVNNGRGHYLFANDGVDYSNSNGSLGKAWGEIRGKNGVVLLEPSPHPKEDGEYAWERPGPVPALPAHVAELMTTATNSAPPADTDEITEFVKRNNRGKNTVALAKRVQGFLSSVAEGASRHQSMLPALADAMNDARKGTYPAKDALLAMSDAFQDAIGGDRNAGGEFMSIASWAVGQAIKEEEIAEAVKVTPPDLGYNHWGSAERLKHTLAGDFVWCPKVKWHAWSEKDGVWVRPAEHILLESSVRSLVSTVREELKSKEGDARVPVLKYLNKVQDISGVEGAIKFLRPLMVGSWDKFDRNTDRLTVANGTLVFEGGGVRLQEHRRGDLITKKSNVTYDPDAPAPDFWLQTLEMFVPNERIRAFLQRLAGSLLVSVGVKEQKIPFFYGNGGCGKSTFAQGMSTILGEDLAVPVDPATIRTAQRSGSSASPDLFALLGARVVIAEEAEDQDGNKSQRIDVGMIKRWSGGTDSTKIVARPMYGDVVKFMPTFTLVLIANNAPDFKDQTDGIWRRLLVIPFNTPVPEGTKTMESTDVAAIFRAEASGMLNWALEGYREWKKGGLRPPPEVLLAGQELRAKQDWIGNFVVESTHDEADGFVSCDDLHAAWQAWRGGDKEIPDLSKRRLGAELKGRKGWGESKVKKLDGKAVRGWYGKSLGVTELAPVTELASENCNRITAGQTPLDHEGYRVTEESVRVHDESEVSAEKLAGFAEKFCNPVTEGVEMPLTCTDAVTEPQTENCNPRRVTGLPMTFDFTTGTTSTPDAAWRRLYRKSEA